MTTENKRQNLNEYRLKGKKGERFTDYDEAGRQFNTYVISGKTEITNADGEIITAPVVDVYRTTHQKSSGRYLMLKIPGAYALVESDVKDSADEYRLVTTGEVKSLTEEVYKWQAPLRKDGNPDYSTRERFTSNRLYKVFCEGYAKVFKGEEAPTFDVKHYRGPRITTSRH